MRKFFANKPSLQEMLKKVLQKERGYQMGKMDLNKEMLSAGNDYHMGNRKDSYIVVYFSKR